MVLASRCSSLMLAAAVMTAGVAGLPLEWPVAGAGNADSAGFAVHASGPSGPGASSTGLAVALLPEVGSSRSNSPTRNRLVGRCPFWLHRGRHHAACRAPHNRLSPAAESRARRVDPARRRTCPPEADEADELAGASGESEPHAV